MHCRSVKEFKEFVSGICAEGGDDDAEDVMGGLKAVTKLSWRDGVLTKVGMQNLDRFHVFTFNCLPACVGSSHSSYKSYW